MGDHNPALKDSLKSTHHCPSTCAHADRKIRRCRLKDAILTVARLHEGAHLDYCQIKWMHTIVAVGGLQSSGLIDNDGVSE